LILTTGDSVEGYSVTAYLGLVSTEAVMGLSFFREAVAGVADVMGGRAKGYEKELHAAKAAAIDEMIKVATSMGADAVTGIRFDSDYIGGSKMSMLMVNTSGTAVRLAQARPLPVQIVGGAEHRPGTPPAGPGGAGPAPGSGFTHGAAWPRSNG